MLVVGDKIKQVKPIGGFDKVGTVFNVVGIENGAISFKSDFGIGMMSWNEYNEHFEKVEQPYTPESKHVWTDWEDPIEDDWIESYVFKTNNKKVIVRCDGIKAESTCHPNDTFDLKKGIAIALSRVHVKQAQKNLEQILKS